jgi:hypothetical protein
LLLGQLTSKQEGYLKDIDVARAGAFERRRPQVQT